MALLCVSHLVPSPSLRFLQYTVHVIYNVYIFVSYRRRHLPPIICFSAVMIYQSLMTAFSPAINFFDKVRVNWVMENARKGGRMS